MQRRRVSIPRRACNSPGGLATRSSPGEDTQRGHAHRTALYDLHPGHRCAIHWTSAPRALLHGPPCGVKRQIHDPSMQPENGADTVAQAMGSSDAQDGLENIIIRVLVTVVAAVAWPARTWSRCRNSRRCSWFSRYSALTDPGVRTRLYELPRYPRPRSGRQRGVDDNRDTPTEPIEQHACQRLTAACCSAIDSPRAPVRSPVRAGAHRTSQLSTGDDLDHRRCHPHRGRATRRAPALLRVPERRCAEVIPVPLHRHVRDAVRPDHSGRRNSRWSVHAAGPDRQGVQPIRDVSRTRRCSRQLLRSPPSAEPLSGRELRRTHVDRPCLGLVSGDRRAVSAATRRRRRPGVRGIAPISV